jgi:hypothetical protein
MEWDHRLAAAFRLRYFYQPILSSMCDSRVWQVLLIAGAINGRRSDWLFAFAVASLFLECTELMPRPMWPSTMLQSGSAPMCFFVPWRRVASTKRHPPRASACESRTCAFSLPVQTGRHVPSAAGFGLRKALAARLSRRTGTSVLLLMAVSLIRQPPSCAAATATGALAEAPLLPHARSLRRQVLFSPHDLSSCAGAPLQRTPTRGQASALRAAMELQTDVTGVRPFLELTSSYVAAAPRAERRENSSQDAKIPSAQQVS